MILTKEEFIQQYVLARANTIVGGIPDVPKMVERGAEAFKLIAKECRNG